MVTASYAITYNFDKLGLIVAFRAPVDQWSGMGDDIADGNIIALPPSAIKLPPRSSAWL